MIRYSQHGFSYSAEYWKLDLVKMDKTMEMIFYNFFCVV